MRFWWTEEQDSIIRKYYLLRGVKKTSILLGRSCGSVAHRASRIGVHHNGSKAKPKIVSLDGYLWIKTYNERVPLHILIYEYFSQKKVEPGKIIHHKNGNVFDNRFENLEELSRAEHQSRHRGEDFSKGRDSKTGRFSKI
jgi:hypothetical protein